MKKIILFIMINGFIFANTLNFVLPQIDQKNTPVKTVQNIKETNETNISDTNSSFVKEINETNKTFQPITVTQDFNDTFVTLNSKINLALIMDKKRFYKYIPSLMNSLIAYFSQKGTDYNITLYNQDVNISSIPSKYIIDYTTNPDKLKNYADYNKTFFFPLLNKNETNTSNPKFYFGALNFKTQINKFKEYIDDKTDIINSDTLIAEKLLKDEENLTFINHIFKYPRINYYDLNNSFVIFNTSASKTAQVLSNITAKDIDTKLVFTPQLGYDPLIIVLTQPADIQKLLIANSIINPPMLINDYAMLLNSGIRYNWLNYSTCVLANKAYNLQNNADEFYMNDFNIYIFNNQINYNTKLYRIINGAFKQVE